MDCSLGKDLDISINGVYSSKHVKLMDQHYDGCVIHENSRLSSMFDDAFTSCTNGTNGINRRHVMLGSPPEPPNTSLLLDELIKDMNTLAVKSIIVTVLERTFTYKPFMFSWMADAIGRMKRMGIGGPSKYVSCSA